MWQKFSGSDHTEHRSHWSTSSWKQHRPGSVSQRYSSGSIDSSRMFWLSILISERRPPDAAAAHASTTGQDGRMVASGPS